MSNSNNKDKNSNKTQTKIIGYRLIPMQASQVDAIAQAEGRYVRPGPRCPKCWLKLKDAKQKHFCRWNIEREGPRDPDPKPYRQPIYGKK